MKGSKPLNDKEIKLMLNQMTSERNKAFLILGIKTGFRVSELLSLTVGDVIQYDKIKDSITVKRSSMKGKLSSRTVVLHKEAKEALIELLSTMDNGNFIETKLFPIGRQQAHKIIKQAANRAKIEGKVSTHSMRKSFAKKIYNALKRDLINTQKALGHKSVQSTCSYLEFDNVVIDNAILEN